MGVLGSMPLAFREGISLFLCDPSGNLWGVSVDPSTGQDGPLPVSVLAQPLQGQNWEKKKKRGGGLQK